jgi:hypothetical protein
MFLKVTILPAEVTVLTFLIPLLLVPYGVSEQLKHLFHLY